MTQNIKFLIGNKAKKTIQSISELNNIKYVNGWLEESATCKCFIKFIDGKIVSIALLRKMDFDPYGDHINPYLINYIHTMKDYRRLGYMNDLLIHIKSRNQITSACENTASLNAFLKAGYKNVGKDSMFGRCDMVKN